LLAENLRFGGGVVGIDGFLYCSPLQANQLMRLDTLALSHHRHIHKNHHHHHHHNHHQKRDLEDNEEGEPKKHAMHFSAAVTARASLKSWQTAKAAMLKSHQKSIEKSEGKKHKRKHAKPHSAQEEDEVTDEEEEEEDSDDDDDNEQEEVQPMNINAFPTGKAMLAIRVYVHWKKFAMKKARERQGYSASDRLIGNRDKHMKSLLLHEPDIWCFGLTLQDSSLADDLCDWLEVFSTTEVCFPPSLAYIYIYI
jgi:hypothetical protein